jgi:hypothetical protein
MLRGLQPPQGMSGPSGLLRTEGKERGPGGKGIGSLQVPFDWQVDFAVTVEPAALVQSGHLGDVSLHIWSLWKYLRGVTSSVAGNVFFVGVETFAPPACMVTLLQL